MSKDLTVDKKTGPPTGPAFHSKNISSLMASLFLEQVFSELVLIMALKKSEVILQCLTYCVVMKKNEGGRGSSLIVVGA